MSPQHPAPHLRSAIRPASPRAAVALATHPGSGPPSLVEGWVSLRGLVLSGVTRMSGGQWAAWGPEAASRKGSVRLGVRLDSPPGT